MNNRLRVLRAERGWSQADLGEKLGVSRQAVNAIETGSTFTTIAILQKSVDIVALLPTDVARMFAQTGLLTILPVTLSIPADTFGIVTRKGGMPTAAADLFIRAVREQSLAH